MILKTLLYSSAILLGVSEAITITTTVIPQATDAPQALEEHHEVPEVQHLQPPQQPQQQQQQQVQQQIASPADSLKYIGPHNIHDHYFKLRAFQKSSHQSILDALKATYHITPIMRDLEISRLTDQEVFEALLKREIAWNYSDLNEFGLMRCEDLKFNSPHFAKYIELIPDGRRILIEKFDQNPSAYQIASQNAKDLQTQCLIKALEKTGSSAAPKGNCQTDIPFCFSDSWQQLWWKVAE